ncbi:MAG: hypothetical protein ACF8MF_06905 [Phycisphaerales bacterium JB052]
MAKVELNPLDPGAFPRIRGAFYTRDTRWGPVAQAWPQKRGSTTNPKVYWNQVQFTWAARSASSMDALQQGTAIEMVKGTEYVPRDFLMMCIYGRAYQIEPIDGITFYDADHSAPEGFQIPED